MFEESVSSVPSIWASMNSWFTPAVLFVLLNVMIGTIAFTSSLANQKQQHQQQQTQDDPQQQQQPRIARSPSVLQRLRSINLYSYRSQEPHPSPPIAAHFNPIPDSNTHYAPEQILQYQTPELETQHVFQQTHFEEERKEEIETQHVFPQTHFEEEQEEEEEPRTLDEVYSQLKDRHVNRSNSDTKPASGVMPERLPTRMRKSASAKSAFAHFEEEDIVEARRPATVREGKAIVTEADDEVDSKADDFINKFKQQLKLQRLDSIIRYKEMINRGSGK